MIITDFVTTAITYGAQVQESLRSASGVNRRLGAYLCLIFGFEKPGITLWITL